MEGKVLGAYRIESELGSGGMGKVWLARDEAGDRYAIKIVHPHLLDTPGFFKRFLREAEIGRGVRHPNVVRTLDCDALGGHHFLVMEYVEGQHLRDLLAEIEQIPEELCRHIGREVAKGLAAIHAAGVVHRDLKPENVLITEDHVVKVMDLGVARLTDEALRLSQTGAFVGSIHYAAPECFTDGGRNVDGRADLHALGLVLYELSAGVNPYFADDVPQILERIIRKEPRRLGDINPQLSPFFEEVVHCLLAKKPGDRFADASALLAVLEDGEDSAWWRARAKSIRAETKRPLRRIRIPRETAVYGREEELAALRALYEQAKAGEGRVVVIEGEAGIGKSRLVDELIARLHRDGEDLDFLFGSYPPNGAATASGAFSRAYREQFGEEGSQGYLPQSPILVPAFDALLRGESAPPDVEPLTKDSLQTCFVQATRTLAAERPTVVLIDDLHFAPEEGRSLFTSLAMAVPGHRVLLIGTTRPGMTENWQAALDRFEHASRLTPPRLTAKDLVNLLEDAFQSKALAESLGLRIIVKSDGNPFFAFEIIHGLREGQFITKKDDGTWISTRAIGEIEIPSSVLDLVNARVADLTEEERDALDVAACWGYEFDPGLIGDVIGLSRIPVLKLFGHIERQHRLVRAAGRSMVFDHHQVQEALYEGLLEQLREEYHTALADALETRTKAAEADPETLDGALCVDLSEQFLLGARGERALRYLEAAEAHLTKGYLNDQAVALAELALGVPGLLTGIERAKMLLSLAGPLDRLGRRARQEEASREAELLAEEAGDVALRGKAARGLGVCLRQVSRHEEAEAAFRRALEIALGEGDRQGEAAATGNLGNVFWSQGHLEKAREHYERSLAISREIGDRQGEANATGNLGLVFAPLGRLEEAREHIERSLAISREIEDREGEAGATGNLGLVFQSQGRLEEAREHLERHLAISREIGDRQGEAAATGNLGVVFKDQGRLEEARERYERHFAISREIGYRLGEAVATGNLGNVFRSHGRLEEAREHDERYLAISREIGDREGEADALHNLGRALQEEGESAPAGESYAECLALSQEIGVRHLEAATHLALGALRVAESDAEGGRASLTTAQDLSAEIGAPGIETHARCHLACLPGGDAQDALSAFTASAEQLSVEERLEARWLLFRATGDRAQLEEAKRLLDEAVANVDEETRESMLTNLRLNREITAAWADHRGSS